MCIGYITGGCCRSWGWPGLGNFAAGIGVPGNTSVAADAGWGSSVPGNTSVAADAGWGSSVPGNTSVTANAGWWSHRIAERFEFLPTAVRA